MIMPMMTMTIMLMIMTPLAFTSDDDNEDDNDHKDDNNNVDGNNLFSQNATGVKDDITQTSTHCFPAEGRRATRDAKRRRVTSRRGRP